MESFPPGLFRLGVATVLAAGLATSATAQQSRSEQTGFPDDWSHHHVIFSDPGTKENAIQNGNYEHWLKVQTDPRFQMQQKKRQSAPTAESNELVVPARDWNVSLGAGGVAATMYPAKYSFDFNNASCSDFVVFPVNAAGSAATAASQTGTFTNTSAPAGSVTITNGIDSITLSATPGPSSTSCSSRSPTSNTGSFHVGLASGALDATNLANLIDAPNCGSFVGVSAMSSSQTVTVTATAPGTGGNNIALANTLTQFAWGGNTLTGGANGQANLLGITKLYSGPSGICGIEPGILFSYAVGTGTIETSPTLSEDGTKVAYVESISGGSRFHVLTIGTTGSNGGSAVTPVVPGVGNNAADTAITMSHGVQVTLSSPFIDYGNDIAYVGDDSGSLHKFTPVFGGTPAEVTTGGWPITVSTSASPILTGPTADSNSGNIFVGDGSGVLWFVQTIAGGNCESPPCVGATTVNVGAGGAGGTPSGRPIIDPPIVDSTTGKVFAFIGCALPSGGDCSNRGGFGEVMQATTALTSPKWIELGTGSGANNLHDGAFDNTYYIGPISSGHLYVCGNPTRALNPMLYQIGFDSTGTMTTASGTTLNLSTNSGMDDAPECSPLQEVYNSNTGIDWLFLGVANYCNATRGGTAGCAQNFMLPTTGFPAPAVAGAAELTGTSGIIVDNISPAGQASNIYFGTLPGGSNRAVKLSQSNLN
jgi:hypothetical protein